MKRTFARQLIIFAREGERLRRWRRILTALSCVVVSLTTYAMILPGLTLEGDYQCGMKEHTHTEACYETGENGEKRLVCPLTEHVHDEHCLAPHKEERPFTLCGIPYEHTHTQACRQNGVLLCTLQEHTHTDACYPTAMERVETRLTLAAAPPDVEDKPGEEFFKEDATYLPIPDKDVRFSILKGGKTVDHALAHGAGYAFNLNVDTYLRSYIGEENGDDKRVYWMKLGERNFTLYAVSDGEQVLLEKYAGEWMTLKKTDGTDSYNSYVEMRIGKDADGYYWFFFRSMKGTADSIMVAGSADSNRSMSAMGLTKTGKMDKDTLAYRYTIHAEIPHVYNAYDQSYYIRDVMILPGTGEDYDAFTENEKSISVTLKTDNDSGGKTIPRIDEAKPDDQIAWVLHKESDEEYAKLWLLNRTKHKDKSEHLAKGPTGYDGWCVCWGIAEDVEINITFLDTHAQRYYGNVKYTNSSFYNCAYLTAANGNQLQAKAENSIPNGILSKTFNARSNTFTILLNGGGEYDLSVFDPLTIEDTMSGATRIADITVVRKGTGADSDTVLEAGTDYTLDDNGGSFRLTINDPKENTFEITYKVKPNGGGETIRNDAAIVGTRIAASAGGSERKALYTDSANNWQFEVMLTKQYEGNNPENGARFGIYEAQPDGSEGTLRAISETVNGYRVLYETDGVNKKPPVRSEPYTKGDVSDTILIDSNVGLYTLKVESSDEGTCLRNVYYIEEIDAPEGYSRSTKRHYFYVTDTSTDGTPAGLNKYTGGAKVTVFTDWQKVVSEDGRTIRVGEFGFGQGELVYNALSARQMPSTGGFGSRPVYLAGAALFLIPMIVLTRRGGVSHKKAETIGKVGKK